jgi:hypothetical protein
MRLKRILFIIVATIYSANLFAQKGTSAHTQSNKAIHTQSKKAANQPSNAANNEQSNKAAQPTTTLIEDNEDNHLNDAVEVEYRVDNGSDGGGGGK